MALLIPGRRRANFQPQRFVGLARNDVAQSAIAAWAPLYGGFIDLTHRGNDAVVVSGGGSGRTTLNAATHRGIARSFASGTGVHTRNANTPSFGTDSNYSIVFWLKLGGSQTNFGSMIGREAGSGGDWEIGSWSTENRLYFGRNGGDILQQSGDAGTDWILHVYNRETDGTGSWYRNGAANSNSGGSGVESRTANGRITFNGRFSAGTFGNTQSGCALGDIAIFGRPLSAKEILALYRDYAGVMYGQGISSRVYFTPGEDVGGGFQPAWARGANTVLVGGRLAA